MKKRNETKSAESTKYQGTRKCREREREIGTRSAYIEKVRDRDREPKKESDKERGKERRRQVESGK